MIRLNIAIFRCLNSPIARTSSYLMTSSTADVETGKTSSVTRQKKKQLHETPSLTMSSNKSSMVAHVFARLQENNPPLVPELKSDTCGMKQKISETNELETLLNIAKNPKLPRESALEVITKLGDWTVESKIKLADFESDPRFINMCRILSESYKSKQQAADLSVVLSMASEDEAAKMLSSTSLAQLVKIISKLSVTKRRSPPLLRSLAFYISNSKEKLSIKQCADILFAIANLNFPDEVLINKVCEDVREGLIDGMKSSVPTSISRSLGILRMRDPITLDHLVDWFKKNVSSVRSQDISAIIMTLAIVDYKPSAAEEFWMATLPLLQPLDLPNSAMFLDTVWSLVILDVATGDQVASVLSDNFIEKLRNEECGVLSLSSTLKLLNIDAAAGCILKDFSGPRLKNVKDFKFPSQPKEKAALVNCIMDTLGNLFPSETFLKRDIDTGAGFLLDGECQVDCNCTPIPVKKSPPNAIRIAVQVLGYHDNCLGSKNQSLGVYSLHRKILEARGYRVLQVSYLEVNSNTKLVNRVQILEQKLKQIVTR